LRELEHEVLREAVEVSPHRPGQRARFDAVELGEIFIEHHMSLADEEDPLLDCWSRDQLKRLAFSRCPAIRSDAAKSVGLFEVTFCELKPM